MAICILNTVTESHEFIEDYFATPVKSPATRKRYLFCQSVGRVASRKAHILPPPFRTPHVPQPCGAVPGTRSQAGPGLWLTSPGQAGQGSWWR